MKFATILMCAAVAAALVALFVNTYIAPLFFNSRLERLHENGLPKIAVEKGATVYCRMKADDFRVPRPPGSRATNAVVSGGFDTVDGSVEARLEDSRQMSAGEYES